MLRTWAFLFCLFILLSLLTQAQADQISLAGKWRFSIDSLDLGIQEKWYSKNLNGTIQLPGTMNTNNLGEVVGIKTQWTASIYDSSFFFQPRLAAYRRPDNYKIPFWLTPMKYYCGPAWYQKDILILPTAAGSKWELFIERTHIGSRVWVDGILLGEGQNSLSTAHHYTLPALLPGKHRISIRIDNRLQVAEVGQDSHSVSDHTQGNWNGMIGRLQLRLVPAQAVTQMAIYPDAGKKSVRVECKIINAAEQSVNSTIQYLIKGKDGKLISRHIEKLQLDPASDSSLVQWISLGEEARTWDEFDPFLYTLEVKLDKNVTSRQFGLRDIRISGKKILVNNRPVFFRGDLNNCEFPLTGHPPMDTSSWLKLMHTLRESGINHIRFHSWCPPDAAFAAADITGIYLQPEAPTWPNHGTSLGDGRFIDQYIYDETKRMIADYGHHPSFIMLAAGNEPAGKNQSKYLAEFIRYWKEKDPRRIYTGASVATSWPLVPENEYMVKSGARGLNWNSQAPSSIDDYSVTVDKYPVPFITHEQGQWCVYPDFSEITLYKGAYRARNLELFREDLREQGLLSEARNFLMASGKLQALCYKMEIERSLRTQQLSGFQLLGLQDFPGQGTALVGVLNAFYQEKGYITKKEFSRFCNSTVPLLKMPKFVWTNTETLTAEAALFHYGKQDLANLKMNWTISDETGKVWQQGYFDPIDIPVGASTTVGQLKIDLSPIKKAGRYTIELKAGTANRVNSWNIWVYPDNWPEKKDQSIYTTDTLDEKAEKILATGGKVLLLLNGKIKKGREVIQSFTPVFWNTSWFKMRPPHTLGLFIDTTHPLWKNFPTSYHSDLQWWEIVTGAQVMHLEDFPKGFRPLISNIDTWFMNRRLAMLFEAKVNGGQLMVCSADIMSAPDQRPAARQLNRAIREYMSGDQFHPTVSISLSQIRDLATRDSRYIFDAYTKGNPDELKPIKQ